MITGKDLFVNLEKDEQNSLHQRSSNLIGRFFSWFLHSPLLYVFLGLISVGLAFGVSAFGMVFGIVFLGAVIGIPVVLYSIVNIKFGIAALLFISFFLGLSRFLPEDVKVGLILDIFLLMMLMGLVLNKWKKNDFTFAGNPISYVVWAWIILNLLEFFNPVASREAWIFVIRGIALLMTFYFIVLNAADNIKYVRFLINFWIALALLGGLYGLCQEFIGLTGPEKAWVAADDFRFNLIVNWGRYRIFSFFSDPTIFGILMAYTGLFCIALLSGPFKLWYKGYLSFCALVMLLSMVYAGTRTAYAMLPAGLLFFALLTVQKRTLMICGVIGAIGAGIIFSDIRNVGPFLSTSSLERLRSAFKPGEDASFQVRERSQAFIKPFIQSHPFGAGLGSIGLPARKFTPGSPLAKFAPDSGYVRVAVELGYVGLIVYNIFFAVILIVGVRNYYRMKDPLLKTYLAGLMGVVFSIVVANYPQEALIQVPTILIFYIIMALIVQLKKLDDEKLKKVQL